MEVESIGKTDGSFEAGCTRSTRSWIVSVSLSTEPAVGGIESFRDGVGPFVPCSDVECSPLAVYFPSATVPMSQDTPNDDNGQVTRLLHKWRAGDEGALGQLTPLVYQQLHAIARRYMRGERASHTLQPTALVNEAYVRMVEASVDWKGRAHFVAVAATMMRRILVDHARARQRGKRAGAGTSLSLEEAIIASPEKDDDLIALDEALMRLSAMDERKSRIVELHFFGGLTYEETAEVIGVSAATIDRELRFSKAWLYRCLRGSSGSDE